MKVQVNKSNSRSYAHNYRITNSTTCDFGFVQPLFMRQLFNSSTKGKVSIKGNLGQFMRLAPMPFPTFGEVKLDTLAVGVPIEQVFPAWASFMSGKDYQYGQAEAYYPVKLPFITNRQLTSDLFGLFATQTIYINENDASGSPSASPAKVSSKLSDVSSVSETLDHFEYNNLSLLPFDVLEKSCRVIYDDNDHKLPYSYTTLDYKGSNIMVTLPTMSIFFDYFDGRIDKAYAMQLLGYPTSSMSVKRVVKAPVTNPTKDVNEIYSAMVSADYVQLYVGGFNTFKLSAKGKALRKVLIGLGYNLSMDDETEMSILPMLACYKAYFDNFFPNRGIDWQATRAVTLINEIQVHNTSDIFGNPNTRLMYRRFLQEELSSMYSTHAMDFISLHTNNVSNGNNPFKENVGIPNSYESGISWQQESSYKPEQYQAVGTDPSTSEGSVGAHPIIPKDRDITSWSIQFVLALQKYVNKDSILGNRVKAWLKSHLNQDVFNSLYNTSDFVSRSSIDVQICDIDSNAATADAQLGSYAGKGQASTPKNQPMGFYYECSTASIFFIFAYISPTTGYYQGSDCTLAMLDKWSMPSSEFDALGYELTPRSVLFTDNGISCHDAVPLPYDATNFICKNKDGFGFMPRASVWKYAKNIVNGDMSLRSKRNTYKSFYLDRELVLRYPVIEKSNAGTISTVHVKLNKSPLASSAWQYISRYDYLSNYNRIFYDAGNESSPTQNVDDNFILHNVIDFTEINSLKPLTISYDVEDGAPMDIEKA
nr:MAG TPA: Major capsid protein [Microviridae sp.]